MIDDIEYVKGRGALSNPANRFDTRHSERFDDGWWQATQPKSIATDVIHEKIKTIISRNQSPDLPYEQSINPYRGCEHGCIYCYARPSHAYWDLSPGLDFESKIIAKPDAARLLEETITRPNYVCKPISIGANTDPYQPLEIQMQTTRQVIEVLARYNHPFSLITKSAMILRDLDLIAELAQKRLCSVAISVTTLDNDLKRKLEPRTASPAARLKAIRELSSAGISVTLMVAPVIPSINDHEIEDILAAGAEAGAECAHYIFLRLPFEISQMFKEWLAEHYPDRADHVMSLVRQSRGGKDYESRFHTRMTAQGAFAELISNRFSIAARKHGLDAYDRFSLDTSLFKRPNEQLSLF